MSPAGALLAYVAPPALGLGLYLALSSSPRRIEALAAAWGLGWLFVNLLLFVPNQFLGVSLDGALYVGGTLAFVVAAATLLTLRRRRLVTLARALLLLQELRAGRKLALVLPLAALAVAVVYKALVFPPASTDALVYHMVLPQQALHQETLAVEPGVGWLDLATTLPNLLVTQQLWVYLGAGGFDEVLVRPIMPIYSLLLLLWVFSDARRWFGLVPALLAAGALYTLNEFASLTIALWAEVPVAFYGYGAVRFVAEGLQPVGNLLLSGLLAGAAVLVKYNGIVLLLALVASLLILALRARSRATDGRAGARTLALQAVSLLLLAGLVAAPLLLRNTVVLGNPVYPAFLGGVGTEPVAPFFDAYPPEDQVRIRLFEAVVLLGSLLAVALAVGALRLRSWTREERFLYPVVLVYLLVYLYFPFRGSYVRYLAPVLPVAALLAGRQLAWWLTEATPRHRRSATSVLLAFAAAVVGLLAVLDVHPPYLVEHAATFLLSAGGFLGLLVLRGRGAGLGRKSATVALLMVLVLPGLFAVVGDRYPPRETAWEVTVLPPDREAHLAARFGDDWRMWQWMNANLAADDRVLTFEPRRLYLQAEVLFGASHELLPTYGMQLEEAVAFVKDLGADYVLDSPWSHVPEINRVFWERSVLFQNLDNRTYFRPVHVEGEVVLYALV